MTPSDKPERSASSPEGDTEQVAVGTKTAEDKAGSASAAQDGETNGATSTTEASDGSSAAQDGEGLDGTDSPPPWQRSSMSRTDTSEQDGQAPSAGSGLEADTVAISQAALRGQAAQPREDAAAARSAASFAGVRTGGTAGTAGPAGTRRPSRGPRRASLQVKRVDPWSVLKLALVLSIALFFVWMIAVAVLYGVLDGMGVWDQLNGTFTELTQADNAANEPLISAGRVFSVASIIGAINIVLITALATVAAFIYNVAADFAGGIEVTLSERE